LCTIRRRERRTPCHREESTRPKRERQYKKVLASIKREGRYKGRQKEVAARIVNKTKRTKGETKSKTRRRSR